MLIQPSSTVDLTNIFCLPERPTDLIISCGFAQSRSGAKRLIKQGAVEIIYHDMPQPFLITSDTPIMLRDGMILHCGKRLWGRFKMPIIHAEVYEFTSQEDERSFLETCPHIDASIIDRYISEDWGS